MFTIFNSLFNALAITTLTFSRYNNSQNPASGYPQTILDGTNQLSLVYRDYRFNGENLYDGYLSYNYYNNRTNNENDYILYPYETHYVVTGEGDNENSVNQRFVYTFGDTQSGYAVSWYQFTLGLKEQINIARPNDTPIYVYQDYFELSRVGTSSTNPRSNYCNMVCDFTIFALNYEETVVSWNFSFPFYRVWEEGGFKVTLQQYNAPNDFSYVGFLHHYYWCLDLHLVDQGDFFANESWSEGYEVGEEEGYAEGYGAGYQDGYGVGTQDGFSQGQSSQNSFRNLFGVLIDTPILYLRKMFDYELFGISVFKALATVISLIVALSVFRLVRGIF